MQIVSPNNRTCLFSKKNANKLEGQTLPRNLLGLAVYQKLPNHRILCFARSDWLLKRLRILAKFTSGIDLAGSRPSFAKND